MTRIVAALLFICWLPATADPPFTFTPQIEAGLARISAESLQANLAFLASDTLEGRDTPSRGLDIAAEFIAAQFRQAGLEPAGNDFFQTARYVMREPQPAVFELEDGTQVPPAEIAVPTASAVNIKAAPVVKVAENATENLSGKVALLEGSFSSRRVRQVRTLQPALIVFRDETGSLVRRFGSSARLVDPEDAAVAPLLIVHDARVAAARTVTVRIEPPRERPVLLRNVIGVLRGSDPKLRDTYVLVSAHYDHLGRKPGCVEGDCIYNGANDDGSGAVSVIEVARALGAVPARSRRTLVFMAFFGEEKGGLGSRYYTRHPVFPIRDTVANVNLEQLGRTDSESGPQIGTATFTGFEFSDLPKTFQAAGELTGVKVYDSPASDDYFSRSDNQMLANAGIPAHTMCVAYSYPDYHAVGDHADKIDYANMARINRMVALGVYMLGSSATPPRWNTASPKTQSYVEAWKRNQSE